MSRITNLILINAIHSANTSQAEYVGVFEALCTIIAEELYIDEKPHVALG